MDGLTTTEMIENIADKFTLSDHVDTYSDTYEFYIGCDSNDADYIRDFLYIKGNEFRKNPLLQYVVSYICGGEKYRGKTRYGCYESYGEHVGEDIHFSWLEGYLSQQGLLLSCEWGPCHSIESIEVIYYSSNGVKKDVNVPSFDELFEGKTEAEMEEFMENLYKKYKDL